MRLNRGEGRSPMNNSSKNKVSRLALAIDDKTKFQLEFASRVSGLPTAKFIEQAVKKAVSELSLSEVTETEENLDEEYSSEISLTRNWSSYWDNEEGVSMVTLLTCELMKNYTTAKDDKIASFIFSHWNYFGPDEKLQGLSRSHCNMIWPHIDNLVEEWNKNKAKDGNCGIKMLNKILVNTDLKPFK